MKFQVRTLDKTSRYIDQPHPAEFDNFAAADAFARTQCPSGVAIYRRVSAGCGYHYSGLIDKPTDYVEAELYDAFFLCDSFTTLWAIKTNHGPIIDLKELGGL